MGRSGITYEQVADAAMLLLDQGRTPTVDHVRDVLGTGSKSTLAPLLKRWKASSTDAAASAEAGLPAPLLQAVQIVYQGMQHDAQEKVGALETVHAAQQAAAQQHIAELDLRYASLQEAHAQRAAALEAAQADLVHLRQQQQADALRHSSLLGDNQGLQARLGERAAQVSALTHQLDQSRQQFEHYQEAVVRQRGEERQAADQRLQIREHALFSAQQQLATSQADAATTADRLRVLQADHAALVAALHDTSEQVAALRFERDRLAFQYEEVTAARAQLARGREADGAQVAQLRAELASQQKMAWMAAQELQAARARLVDLETPRPVPPADAERAPDQGAVPPTANAAPDGQRGFAPGQAEHGPDCGTNR